MKRILPLSIFALLTLAIAAQPANDDCNSATVISPANLDDGNGNCVPLLAEDNTGATGWEISPGLFFTGNCWGGAIDSVVFYQFTAQGVSGLVEATNGPGMAHVSVIEFTGAACDGTNAVEVGCAVDAPITFDNDLTIGTTYYVVVGFAGNPQGTFDLCVFNPVPAPNDECIDAIDLSNLDGSPCNTSLDNYYPSTDAFIPACFPATATYTVWYKFVAQGVSIADLHVEGGPDVANVAVWDFSGQTACDLANGVILNCETNVDISNPIVLDNQLTIGSEYYISVSFDNNATGTFSLCLDNPEPAFNDDCMNAPEYPASELSVNNCLTSIGGNPLNNDWPSTDIGQTYGCWTAGSSYNVWFYFVAQGPDLVVDVNPSFGEVEQMAVLEFTGNPCETAGAQIVGCANGNNLEIDNALDPGQIYYVTVGFSNNGVGSYCIDLFNPQPPPNDTTCGVIPVPTCVSGTTTNANPDFTEGSFPQSCMGLVDNTVWYSYQLSDPNNVGIELDFSQTTMAGNVSIVLFEDPTCGVASTFSIFDFYCGPPPADPLLFGPVDENAVYYIMIGSEEAGEGGFDFCITEIAPCFDNNLCDDPGGVSSANDLGVIPVQSSDCSGGPPPNPFVCAVGCNLFASPDPSLAACLGSPPASPTVWYTFQTDANAAILNLSVTSQQFDAPAVQLWLDNGSGCGSLVPVGLTQSNAACVSGSGGELIANNTDIGASQTYYISVAGVNTVGGEFELCLTTLEQSSNCVLDANLEVTNRTFSGPLTGPFFPGETVSLCMNVNSYTSSGNNCQWFQGIVPVFGNGWDPALSFESGLGSPPVNSTLNGSSFPANGQSSSGTTWDWFENATYHHPHCFYNIGDFDGNGSLDMCNGLYDENCVGPGLNGGSGGPCWGGAPGNGDILPPGWFAYGIDGLCPGQTGHPSVDYGDGNCCSCTMGPWEFCFDLTLREHPDCEQDMTTMDLTVGFITFADGETGSWNGGPSICGEDEPIFEKLPGCCVELVNLTDEHPPFCSGGVFSYSLDDPNVEFWEWTVNAPTTITGASGGSGGNGTVVIDNLTNTGTNSEVVTYNFLGFDGGDCPSVILEVNVEVFAEIQVDMEPFTVCSTPTNPYEIIPNVTGGDDASYMFEWQDGSSNSSFTVIDPEPGVQYVVTVTDAVGCSGVASVVLDVYETFPVDITAPVLGQCIVDGPIDLSVTASGGMPGYTYNWSSPMGNVYSGDMVAADEAGQWEVTATDSEGCVGSDSITLSFFESPMVSVFPQDVAVCPDNVNPTQMTGAVENGEPPYIFEWTTPTGLVVTTSFLLATDAGIYSLLVTDANGCTTFEEFQIDEAEAPDFDLGGDMTVCQQELFAGIVLQTPDDPSYLFYDWSTGDDTPQIIVDSAGTYQLTITNINGCRGTSEVTIDLYPGAAFSLPDTFEFCQDNFGVLDAGPGFVEYEWSTGDFGPELFIFNEALIFITVTDENGCTYTDEVQTIETELLSPAIAGDSVICNAVPIDLTVTGSFATYNWSTGDDTETTTVAASGWYYVTVSDGDGCEGVDSVFIDESAPDPTITGIPVVCSGQSAMLNAGTWASVEWSTGESTSSISVDMTGTYTVTVTDDFGCQNVASQEVTVEVNPEPEITGSTSFCAGASTSLDAGAGFDTYTWSTGDDTQTTSVSATGTVYVTVTNAAGCQGVDSIDVTALAPVTPAITGDTVICNSDAVNLDAGSGYVTYAWSSGEDTQVINVSSGNTYTVTVTDADGCTGTDSFVVLEATPDPEITGNQEVCEGGNTTITATAGFESYAWSTSESTESIQVNATGTYSVTVTDEYGCTGTESFDFTVNPDPTPDISGSTTFCTGSSTTLDAGAGYSDYLWTGGGTSQTLLVDIPGDYFVTVTDGNGCSGTAMVTVEESDELILNVADQTLCEGDVVTLSVGNFDSYEWSTGAMTPTIDVSSPGTIGVTVTDITGCTGTADIEVTVNPEPFADVASEAATCNAQADGSVIDFSTLVTGGDLNGIWTDVDGSGASGTFPVLDFDGVPEGTYTFEYSTNSAIPPCEDQQYLVTVTVEDCACPAPDINQPSPLCNDNGVLDLNDLLIPGVTEPGGTWSIIQDPGGFNPATLNGSMFDATNADAGTYEIQYQLSGLPSGCPDTDTKQIMVNNRPDAGVPGIPAQICLGEDTMVILADLLVDADAGGMWMETSGTPSTGGAFNAGQGSFRPTAQDAGVYTFEYILTGEAPCPDASTTVEVVIENVPVADAGADAELTCDTPDVTLGGTNSSMGSEFEYIWTTSGGGVITDTFSLNTEVSSAGVYTLTVRNKETGCESYDDVEISLADDLPSGVDVNLQFPQCPGDPPARYEVLSVTGGEGPYTYTLNGGDPTTTPVFNNLTPGDYVLRIEDSNGCPFETSFSIPTVISLEGTITGDLVISRGDEVTLNYNLTSGTADSTIWLGNGDVLCVNCDSLIFAPLQQTTVELIIYDQNGCFISLETSIQVQVSRELYVPNVFTPNGDGANEYVTVFSPSAVDKVEFFEVFTRWGEKVYSNSEFDPNIPSEGWDGTFGGEPLMPGVYVFQAKVRYADEVTETIKGDITLLR